MNWLKAFLVRRRLLCAACEQRFATTKMYGEKWCAPCVEKEAQDEAIAQEDYWRHAHADYGDFDGREL